MKHPLHITLAALAGTVLLMSGFWPLCAHGQDLADYFGFTGLEVIRLERGAGPISLGDVNDDGLLDVIAVNNFKSRLEVHYQRSGASPEDAETSVTRTNDLPEHWRFRRQPITVSHRIGAVLAHDFDADGLTDLIYASQQPAEVVFMRQAGRGVFEQEKRHRVRGLMANKDSLAIADLIDDEAPELVTIADGEVQIWSMDGASLELAKSLGASTPIVAFWIEDYDGNARLDIAGASPDDSAPVRLWLGGEDEGAGVIGPQLRFEMPPIVECEPMRLPGLDAARLAVIERPSRRLIVYEVVKEMVEQSGDRDASMQIFSFTDAGNRTRDVSVMDVDGDGLLDLVATDTEASAVVVYQQSAGRGMQGGTSHPSLADLQVIAGGDIDGDSRAELFVLSEKESVVGRTDLGGSTVEYPVPVNIPDGKTPVTMGLVRLSGAPVLAVALKESRKYSIGLIDMAGGTTSIDLGSRSRSPDSIVGLDADQDGQTDLLLLTEDKPMTMLRAQSAEDGTITYDVLESKDMGQFGLVQAATSTNTTVFDIDGDGLEELLVADRNFVRAVRFVPDPPPGVSPGWQVVKQINAKSPDSRLVSVTVFPDRIIAADQKNSRLVMFGPDVDSTTGWSEHESVHMQGFEFEQVFAGSFSGDGENNVLAVGDDGFAVIRLAGERVVLKETNTWRSEDERRQQHELTSGDVNSDGFVDLVSLDAGEQMLEVLTFSDAGSLLYGISFQTYESRMFTGGESREFEPSQCLIGDVTGDGAADLILLAHDRMLLYPQMTEDNRDNEPARR